MRLVLRIPILLVLAAAPLAAQGTAVASRQQRSRASCQRERVERVIVGDANGRTGPLQDSIAADIGFWFRPEFAPSSRNTAYTVVVTPAGLAVEQQHAAGDTAFDRVTRQAIDAAGHEHAFARVAPAAGGPPVALTVHFGEDLNGRRLPFAERSVCLAEQRADSPRPSFPMELTPNGSTAPVASNEGTSGTAKSFMYGSVDVTFVVDSAGRVVQETFQVVNSTHPSFTREVKRILPLLRYYPAELGGRPAAQVVTQHFDFSAH